MLISAELLSTNGDLIASEAKSVEVPPGGSTWVNLFFLGTDIAGSVINGPYTVSLVTMYDESDGTIMDSMQKAYTTAAYTASAFIAKLFEVKPGASGMPSDMDGNGLYNSLDVTIPVEVFNPGQVKLEGVLLTTNGVVVSHIVKEVFYSAPTNSSIVLAFPGGDIRTHGLNGPYVLGDLYVSHSGAPENLTYLSNVFTSGLLLALSFEGGIVGIENVTDKTTATFPSWQLDRASGALFGTLVLQNKTNSTKFLRDAFWYALVPSTNVMLAKPSGTTPDGKPYVDITALVNAALPSIGNGDLVLDPGEQVTVSGIEFYSRDLSIPQGFVFAMWADPPVFSGTDFPRLEVSQVRIGSVTLTWPATKSQFVVEEADNINSTWKPVLGSPVVVGGQNTLTIPMDNVTKFYRLRNN